MRSEEFIFKTLPSGDLKFVGDFEEFYKTEDDPWQQAGKELLQSYLDRDAVVQS